MGRRHTSRLQDRATHEVLELLSAGALDDLGQGQEADVAVAGRPSWRAPWTPMPREDRGRGCPGVVS
jgi:hypothetical protein